jgi:hypothetical protein
MELTIVNLMESDSDGSHYGNDPYKLKLNSVALVRK